MTALTCTITNAGRAAMVDPTTGGTRAVTITQAGFTDSVFTVAPTLTALPGEFKRVSTVAGTAVDNTTVHLTVRDDSTDAYSVHGIALYLSDGTLFAVYGQAGLILSKADVSTFFLAADLKVLAGTATSVTFGNTNFLNPTASETILGVSRLATAIEALAGSVADKTITPATLASVLTHYVGTALLGATNGVATLGSDGKLAVAQRPPIDLIDVWPVANQAAMLALSTATVGDFAVRADSGLIYVLQVLPASTLGNWLEISTPAPVSSVNGKVGTVVLTPADVSAAAAARTITATGLASGGGDLSANRTIDVPAATQSEAAAGTLTNKALTPNSVAPLFSGKVSTARTIGASGLATGGGDLSADRVISVAIASAAEILAGTENGKAITPAGLAAIAKSLTPNGYYCLPGGLIVQWLQYRYVISGEQSIAVSWPIAFPTGAFAGSATGYLAFASPNRNLFAQLIAPNQYGGAVMLQKISDVDLNLDGFDVIIFGY